MTAFNRRQFLKLAGATSLVAAMPRSLSAATPLSNRVVIIGGGFAGATAAKYLKHWDNTIDVTLVEPNATHYACILSNLVITGAISMNRINLSYDGLRNRGVKIVQALATAIDPVGSKVGLSNGATLDYEHLILAPGIDFINPNPAGAERLYDPNLTPHAWKAGPQTTLLKNQLAAMPDGGVFVMNVPKTPYRCPPGPYERACIVAAYLKRKKRRSKIIVLDANPDIVAEPHTFGTAFSQTYAGTLEYHANVGITQVNSSLKTIDTTIGALSADVLNMIPNQKAGQIVFDAGVVNDPTGRWATVDPLTYGSTVYENIYVIGDSQATAQPKSGHMANSQAKVCVDSIIRAFVGETPDPQPTTNSACFSPITETEASWLTAVYQYDPTTHSMKRVEDSFGEAAEPSSENYEHMSHWADNIFADSFR